MAASPQASADIEAENERLKAENLQLREKLTMPSASAHTPHGGRIRRISAALLVVLAVLLVTIGNLLFWFGNTLTKPDRFADATATIIKDPVVQQASASYTTAQLFASTDVQNAIETALPPRADFLAPQLTTQLRSFTQDRLEKIFANTSFQNAWNQFLQKQQQRLIQFATTYQGNGTVSLNDIFTQASGRLANTRLSFLADKQLPANIGNITIINATWLPALHQIITHIDLWRALSLILVVAAVAGAVLLSANRRKILWRFSFAISGAMLITLIALRFAKAYVSGKAEPQYSAGVRHALDAFLQPLRAQTITILLLGVILGSIAWITGPTRRAVSLRNRTSAWLGRASSYLPGRENRFTKWLRIHKRTVEWGIAITAGIVLLIIHLTTVSLLVTIGVVIVLIALVELFSGDVTYREPST